MILFKTILFLLVPLGAQAQGSLDSIMEAQTLEAFVEIEQKMAKSQKSREICGEQLQSQVFPADCLAQLDRDFENSINPNNFRRHYQKVNKLCVAQAQSIAGLDKIHELLQLDSLSDSCRQQLEERQKDLVYMEGSGIGPDIEIKTEHEENKVKKRLL